MNTIIFLGGIPGSGKTTLAYKLASIYKIDKVISLDVIKSTLKCLIESDDKYLFTTTHQAYKLDNLNVVEGFLKHSKSINDYFYKIIKKFTNEKVIIVEGATITNEFVNRFKDSNIIYLNLYVDDLDKLVFRYKEKCKMRKGLWEENINEILKINDYLIHQSNANINSLDNNILESVGKYINESIFL